MVQTSSPMVNLEYTHHFAGDFGVYLFGAYCREHGTAMINRSNWAENMVYLHTIAIFKMTLVTLVTSVGDMMF